MDYVFTRYRTDVTFKPDSTQAYQLNTEWIPLSCTVISIRFLRDSNGQLCPLVSRGS